MTLKAIREYLKESLQTERLKGKKLKFTLKTNGDFDLFGKKLYAIYESGERISPFYSANEWDGWKIEKALMKYWL